jgi:hypothetical protein
MISRGLFCLVAGVGFEPTTSGLRVGTQPSHTVSPIPPKSHVTSPPATLPSQRFHSVPPRDVAPRSQIWSPDLALDGGGATVPKARTAASIRRAVGLPVPAIDHFGQVIDVLVSQPGTWRSFFSPALGYTHGWPRWSPTARSITHVNSMRWCRRLPTDARDRLPAGSGRTRPRYLV